jgi:CHASE2 domain-containing sensor protein
MCRLIAADSTPWVRIHASTISFMGSIRLANRPAFNVSVGNRLQWEIRYMFLCHYITSLVLLDVTVHDMDIGFMTCRFVLLLFICVLYFSLLIFPTVHLAQ